MTDLSTNMQYGLDVDFSAYDPSNYYRSLRVQPSEGDEIRTFDELGTGQEQVLALAFAYAYAMAFRGAADDLLLVIEEPEAHLHPLAQEWLAQKVQDTAAAGVQVVLTTHSPYFIRLEGLEGIVLVRRTDGATQTKQLTREELALYCNQTGAERATPESVVRFYSAAATEEILSGFFARKIVLVEGPTEALALPLYLSKLGLSTPREGVAVIPVHGVANLAKWWRLFTAYEIPTYVMFDNDASDDSDGGRRRELLRALGYTHEDAERIVGSDEWIVEGRFAVSGRTFEHVLRTGFPEQYERLEIEASQEFGLPPGQAKPLIARFVAQRIDFELENTARANLEAVAQAIRDL